MAFEHEHGHALRELWGERLVLLCLLPFYVGLSQPLGIVPSGALVMVASAGMLLGAWLVRSAGLRRIDVSAVRLKRTNPRLKLVNSVRH